MRIVLLTLPGWRVREGPFQKSQIAEALLCRLSSHQGLASGTVSMLISAHHWNHDHEMTE